MNRILKNIPFPEYVKMPGVNQSVLKHHARSAAHAYYYMTHGQDATDEMELGEAAHAAILEPERFRTGYAVMPRFEGHPNSNAYKAAKAAWLANLAPGAIVMTQDDKDAAEAMANRVWADPDARSMLECRGANEVVGLWKDEATGLDCKMRADRLAEWNGCPTVVEVKSSKDAREWSFEKDMDRFGYNLQAAMYLDGLNTIAPCPRRHAMIVVENAPPYLVRVYETDPTAIEEGRRQLRLYLSQHAKCLKTGMWPGYQEGLQTISIPKYAFRTGSAE